MQKSYACIQMSACLVILAALSSSTLNAQSKPHKPSFRFGASTTLRFRRPFLIDLQPTITYAIDKKYHLGLSFPYIYTRAKYFRESTLERKNNHAYGIQALLQANVWRALILYGSYGSLNYAAIKNFEDGPQNRNWIPMLFLGLGSYIDLKNNWRLLFLWNHDLLYEEKRLPYATRSHIRISIFF